MAVESYPAWFTGGEAITDLIARCPDAEHILEDDELDYDWRLCQIPVAAFGFPGSYDEYRSRYVNHDHSSEAMDNIENWLQEVGNAAAALDSSPIIVFIEDGRLNLLDGYHRFAIAHYFHGLEVLTACVADPKAEPKQQMRPG